MQPRVEQVKRCRTHFNAIQFLFCICSQNLMFDLSLPGKITVISLSSRFDRTTSVRLPDLSSIRDRLTGGEVILLGIWRSPSRNSFDSDLAVKLCICLGVSTICTSGVKDRSLMSSNFVTCNAKMCQTCQD